MGACTVDPKITFTLSDGEAADADSFMLTHPCYLYDTTGYHQTESYRFESNRGGYSILVECPCGSVCDVTDYFELYD